MSDPGGPAAAFGRRGRRLPPPEPTVAVKSGSPSPWVALPVVAAVCGFILAVIALVWTVSTRQTIRRDEALAEQQVVAIVNQPVTHLPRRPDVELFSPGWFDPGAETPDFAHIDVRTTQQPIYEKYDYVTSDLNPSEMFIGSELEFNAQTKYFYSDRTLPKKRLSEAEMLEINRLYRIIAHDRGGLVRSWGSLVAIVALLAISGLAAVRVSLNLKSRAGDSPA